MLTTDSVSGPGGTSFKTREYVYDALRGVLTDIKLSGSTTSLTTNGNLVSTALAMPGGASLGRQLGSTSAAIKDTTESTNNNYLERWLGINYPGQIDRHLRWTAKVGRWFDYDSLGQLLKGRTMVRNPGATLPGGCPTADFGMSGSCTPLADYGTVDSLVYSYDAAGNRTDQSGAYTTGNRMTTFASCSYKTDAEGNVVRRSGSSPCVQIDSLFWTAEGQLDSVKLGSTGLKYRYDAAGRLVQKRVNGSSSSYFLWEGDNLLAELNGTASSVKAEYSYYPGLDNLQALIVGGTVYYARTDGLGSVLALSDTTKAVKSTYEYDDWGHLTVGGDSASFNGVDRARWKGALWLGSEVELYYMRNRWYEPYSGRFLSEDPIGLAGGINPAVFAGNDPVNRRDPYGLKDCYWTLKEFVCDYKRTATSSNPLRDSPFSWGLGSEYEQPWGPAAVNPLGHGPGDLVVKPGGGAPVPGSRKSVKPESKKVPCPDSTPLRSLGQGGAFAGLPPWSGVGTVSSTGVYATGKEGGIYATAGVAAGVGGGFGWDATVMGTRGAFSGGSMGGCAGFLVGVCVTTNASGVSVSLSFGPSIGVYFISTNTLLLQRVGSCGKP